MRLLALLLLLLGCALGCICGNGIIHGNIGGNGAGAEPLLLRLLRLLVLFILLRCFDLLVLLVLLRHAAGGTAHCVGTSGHNAETQQSCRADAK